MKRLFLALPVLVAVLALLGCGSSNKKSSSKSSTPAPAKSTAAGNKVAVAETEYKLSPASPKVKKGMVTFNVTNQGKITHSLEVVGPAGEKKLSKTLQPGQSGTVVVDFTKDGKYQWYCPIDGHKGLGMKGQITVGSGGGGSSSGSSGSSGGGGSGY
jgi:uncharacterized cupredoxin-like copper-binding protein